MTRMLKVALAALLLSACGSSGVQMLPDPGPATDPTSVVTVFEPSPVVTVVVHDRNPIVVRSFSKLPLTQTKGFAEAARAIAVRSAVIDWGGAEDTLDGWEIWVWDADMLPTTTYWPIGAGAITMPGLKRIEISTSATGKLNCAQNMPIQHEVGHAVMYELGLPQWGDHTDPRYTNLRYEWLYEMQCH